MPQLILLFLCTTFILSCADQHPARQTITVNLEDTSQVWCEISGAIALDTIAEAIVGGVDRISFLQDGKILVLDERSSNMLCLFDANGDLLRSTVNGKGPGELMSPVDFSLWRDRIYVFDMGQDKLIVYDMDLSLVEEREIKIFAKKIEALDDNI